jgi:hypothetical protein
MASQMEVFTPAICTELGTSPGVGQRHKDVIKINPFYLKFYGFLIYLVLEYRIEHVKEGVLVTTWDAILQESLKRVEKLSLRDFVKGRRIPRCFGRVDNACLSVSDLHASHPYHQPQGWLGRRTAELTTVKSRAGR